MSNSVAALVHDPRAWVLRSGEATQTGDRGCGCAVRLQGFERLRAAIIPFGDPVVVLYRPAKRDDSCEDGDVDAHIFEASLFLPCVTGRQYDIYDIVPLIKSLA